jgi:hypothetical protein
VNSDIVGRLGIIWLLLERTGTLVQHCDISDVWLADSSVVGSRLNSDGCFVNTGSSDIDTKNSLAAGTYHGLFALSYSASQSSQFLETQSRKRLFPSQLSSPLTLPTLL